MRSWHVLEMKRREGVRARLTPEAGTLHSSYMFTETQNTTQWVVYGAVGLIIIGAVFFFMQRSSVPEAEIPLVDLAGAEIEQEEVDEPTRPSQAVTTTASGESVSVENQAAGSSVVITSMHLTRESWVAVRDAAGWVLGAARFAPGTTSGTVRLLRETEAGQNYAVIIYIDNGNRIFDIYEDAVVEGINENFMAE